MKIPLVARNIEAEPCPRLQTSFDQGNLKVIAKDRYATQIIASMEVNDRADMERIKDRGNTIPTIARMITGLYSEFSPVTLNIWVTMIEK